MQSTNHTLFLALSLSMFALLLAIAPSTAPIVPALAVMLVLMATMRSSAMTR